MTFGMFHNPIKTTGMRLANEKEEQKRKIRFSFAISHCADNINQQNKKVIRFYAAIFFSPAFLFFLSFFFASSFYPIKYKFLDTG